MKTIIKCPICSSNNLKLSFKNRDKNLNTSKRKFSMLKCVYCKNYLLQEILEEKEFNKLYPKKEYYSYSKINTGNKTKLKMLLYKTYYSKENNFLMKILFSPLKFIARGTMIKKDASILDIGCGSGQFLYEMKNLGLKVQGIETGQFNKSESKKYGLNISNKKLSNLDKKFDIITINHVLEHIENPRPTLKDIKKLMDKKSTLLIGVPNKNSLARLIFQKNWYQWDIPRHLVNYSTLTLKKLLEEENLKVIKIRYNSRPSQFVSSLYYSFNLKKTPKILNLLLGLIFLPLTWLVNILRIGDQVEIWCKKK